MSFNPFKSTIAPYTYRIFTPVLVFSLPFEHLLNFIIINVSALIATSILFFYYLKRLNFKTVYCFIGVLIFILSPNVLYCMYNIALVDALAFLFYLAAFYAILSKNDKLYLLILFIGVLNKETILFTIPFFFLCKLENKRLIDALKSTILIITPSIVLFIFIRVFYGLKNYISIDTVKETILYQFNNANNILVNPYLSFGVLWIIGLYNIKYNDNNFIKKSLIVLPFIFLQILIATDTSRSLFLAFPIIIPLSLYVFRIKNIKILLIFFLMSLCTLCSYLISIIARSNDVMSFIISLNNIYSFLILPSELLISTILFIIITKSVLNNEMTKKNYLK